MLLKPDQPAAGNVASFEELAVRQAAPGGVGGGGCSHTYCGSMPYRCAEKGIGIDICLAGTRVSFRGFQLCGT